MSTNLHFFCLYFFLFASNYFYLCRKLRVIWYSDYSDAISINPNRNLKRDGELKLLRYEC